MTRKIEKVMVFKALDELPPAYKHLVGLHPDANQKVVVVAQRTQGAEVYLTVKHHGISTTHSARNFRTVAASIAREKLISKGANAKLIARL